MKFGRPIGFCMLYRSFVLPRLPVCHPEPVEGSHGSVVCAVRIFRLRFAPLEMTAFDAAAAD